MIRIAHCPGCGVFRISSAIHSRSMSGTMKKAPRLENPGLPVPMIHIKSRSNLPGEMKGVSRRNAKTVEVENRHRGLKQGGRGRVRENDRFPENQPQRDCQ